MAGGSAEQPFRWEKITRGDDISDIAILAGYTQSDGDVYVGRNEHGVGKLNHENGKMWNIWVQGASATQDGEILIVSGEADWVKVNRGDALPLNAVLAGHTKSDGDIYSCRHSSGEVGKLNLDKGKVYNMWYHGHWTAKKEGEILCVSAPVSLEAFVTPSGQTNETSAGYLAVLPGGAANPGAVSAPAALAANPELAASTQPVAAPKAPLPPPPSCQAGKAFGVVGNRIQLSNEGCTALRSSGINCGVCVGKEPLTVCPEGRYYELRVDAKYKSPRALAVGITVTVDADAVSERGLIKADEAKGNLQRMWLIGYDHGGALFCSDGTPSKIPDKDWRPVRHVKEGTVIGVLWAETSNPPELVIFQDGLERVRQPATGRLPHSGEDIFALVDLQGCVSQVTLLDSSPPKPPSNP